MILKNNNSVDIFGIITKYKKLKRCVKFILQVESTEIINGLPTYRTDWIKCVSFNQSDLGLKNTNSVQIQGTIQNSTNVYTNKETGERISSQSIQVVVALITHKS